MCYLLIRMRLALSRYIPAVLAVASMLTSTEPGRADEEAVPWCAPELETLAHDVCYHAEPAKDGERRTLVVFLHGLVQEGADWQHNQQRGAVRGGKRNHFSVIAPRGRAGLNKNGAALVAWPTSRAAQEQHEAAMLAEWLEAQRAIEKRAGKAFDEVFVVGFSNGAYYAASLALRGRVDVDGFAVFAGGASYGAPTTVKKAERVPVFVGVAGKDKTTADDSRSLARTLKKHGWPHQTETRPVGHAVADAHLDHAIAYLRAQKDERTAKTASPADADPAPVTPPGSDSPSR